MARIDNCVDFQKNSKFDIFKNKITQDVRELFFSEIPEFLGIDNEMEQMEKAKKFIEFYKKYERMPSIDNDEKDLCLWRCNIQYLFPNVKKILSEIPEFFMFQTEEYQMHSAIIFVKFFKILHRYPSITGNFDEFQLHQWRHNMKNLYKIYPDVQKFILSEIPDFFEDSVKTQNDLEKIEKAKKFIEFCKTNGRLPNFEDENELWEWGSDNYFGHMDEAEKFVEFCKKNGRYPSFENEIYLWSWRNEIKYSSKINPDVRDYLISNLPDFFKNDIEIDQMLKAKKFVEFYKLNNRLPNIEDKLWGWYNEIKYYPIIDPGVREYLISEVPNFFKDDSEQMTEAKRFVEFYKKNGRLPSSNADEERELFEWRKCIRISFWAEPSVVEYLSLEAPIFFNENPEPKSVEFHKRNEEIYQEFCTQLNE